MAHVDIRPAPPSASKMLDFGFESVGWGPQKLTDFSDQQLLLIRKRVESGRVRI